MWGYLLIALLVVGLIWEVWRRNAKRQRIERERAERKARTDELLARVLLGEKSAARPAAGARPSMARPAPPPIDRMVKSTVGGQRIDVDVLLSDESDTVAGRMRGELARPTGFLADSGVRPAEAPPAERSASTLSLHDGELDVPLDALAVAWFQARGYVARSAPASAQPISLLLSHRDDPARRYAFHFYRGWLTLARATALLDKARAHGLDKLLVAAEHGADAAVGSARLRDVQVIDWPTIDREFGKLDARVAAKIVAIARMGRGTPTDD